MVSEASDSVGPDWTFDSQSVSTFGLKHEERAVQGNTFLIIQLKYLYLLQELFETIDKEDDGAVYLKEIVIHLRAVNEDINENLKVKMFLDELDTNGTMEVDFKQFCVSLHFLATRLLPRR